MAYKIPVYLLVCLALSVWAEDIFVVIPNGTLRGKREYSSRNLSFYAFQEIPFAKPPIGDLRFKAPEPAEPWEGILNVTKNTKICVQQTASTEAAVETEDCLYLNVYTPVYPSNTSLPVMVYIYGGGFVSGSATFDINGPHYFMENDVLVVTVAYRVGPFGFLSTGDTVIPGNYGLKDQNLGLRWVRDNIRYFGGDPDKVTIFGQSAGGASVTFQMMSKKSEGLFRAGISQSGSILCPWAYQRDYKQYAYRLATAIDNTFNPNSTSSELLEFLQKASTEQIRVAHKTFYESLGNEQMIQGFWFTPVVEPEHETAFLTESMYEAIEKGHMNRVPLMIGVCSEEMIWRASNINDFNGTMKQYESNLSLLVNRNMHVTDHSQNVEIGGEIRRIYTQGLFQDYLGGGVRYYSDMAFTRPIIRHAELQSQYSDVYFYQFSYHGKLGNNGVYVEGAERVGHAEDNSYLWVYSNYSSLDYNAPEDILTSDRYRALFTNFAKTLNPTPEASDLLQNIIWPKVAPNNFQYLNINDTLSIETNPKGDIFQKWVDLYEERAVKPYDTF